MVETIENLPKYDENPFTHKDDGIYLFDDDSVCNNLKRK